MVALQFEERSGGAKQLVCRTSLQSECITLCTRIDVVSVNFTLAKGKGQPWRRNQRGMQLY